jgi:conjugal transfer/entry exclusion protein
MRRLLQQGLVVGLLALYVLPIPGDAQVAAIVFDPTNYTANLVTSVQSVITAVEAVAQTANMILELTPLDDIAIAGDFAQTMGLVAALIEEGQALMGDAQQAQAQIEALFQLDTAPRNLQDLNERVGAIQEVLFESRRYAVRVQTLISSINSAVGHIISIVELVGGLIGNMQGNQVNAQLLATANLTLATQAAQAAASQREQVLNKAARSLVVESYRVIEAQRWADWPSL